MRKKLVGALPAPRPNNKGPTQKNAGQRKKYGCIGVTKTAKRQGWGARGREKITGRDKGEMLGWRSCGGHQENGGLSKGVMFASRKGLKKHARHSIKDQGAGGGVPTKKNE